MAAKLAGPGGGGKFAVEANSEINVTPFVDVMLVLLIIFMVAAPLASVSIKVDLPNAAAPPSPNPPKPIYLSIKKDSSIYVGDSATDLDSLGGDLKKLVGTRDPAHERIFIRADKDSTFGDFTKLMGKLQDEGFYSVALVGEDHSTK
jgi:biopolymer transport protein ExbD